MLSRPNLVTAVFATTGLLIVASLLVPVAHALHTCRPGESEKACIDREIAACVKNPKGFHNDWVMDCIQSAGSRVAKMEDICQTWHTIKAKYGSQCAKSPTDPVIKVFCKHLEDHNNCAE